MHDTTVDQQPVDLLHSIAPADLVATDRIPLVRSPFNRHRVGDPGKVPIAALIPELVLPQRRGPLAWLAGAR